MPSPWKRVDLLNLSSTSAALARRRAAAAAAATTPTSTLKGIFSSSGQDDNEITRRNVAEVKDYAKPVTSAASVSRSRRCSDAPHCTHRLSSTPSLTVHPASAATRVSISRLLGGASLTWQESLACFVELVEGSSKRGPQDKEQPLQVQEDCAVPLEAILSLYATLRRNAAEQQHTMKYGEELNTTLSSAVEEEDHLRGNAFPQLPATDVSSRRLRCSSSPSSANDFSSVSLFADTLPLRFLAYAAQHNTALAPLHRVLSAAFRSNVGGASPPPSPTFRPGCERQEGGLGGVSLSREVVNDLTQLLSVATVLHVGLGEILQAAPAASPTKRTAEESSSLSASATSSSWQLPLRWAALRTIHNLERYGGAREYVAALSESVERNFEASTGSGVAAQAATGSNAPPSPLPRSQRETHGLDSARAGPHRTRSQPTASLSPSSPHHLSVLDAAVQKQESEVQHARAVVEAAARQQPNFTLLLQPLQEAWEAHNTRRLPATTSTHRTPPAGGTGANGDLFPSQTETVTSTPGDVCETMDGTVPSFPSSSSSVQASAAAADVALAMVRSLAQTDLSAAHVDCSGVQQGDAAWRSGSTMSTAELTCLTLDVVHFTWTAMNAAHEWDHVENSSHTSGSPSTEEQLGVERSAAARTAEGEALLQLVRTATRFASYADLCTWLERLLPPTPPAAAPAVSLGVRDYLVTANGNVSLPQRAALLCLLTRVVRRAPSWSAVCTVLPAMWRRIPTAAPAPASLRVPNASLRLRHTDEEAAACGSGYASCPSLLSAFFESPHAPTRRPHTRDELAMWCKAICGASGITGTDKTAYKESVIRPASAKVTHDASPGTNEGQLSAAEWSRLLYGSAPPTIADVSVCPLALWHSSVTAAATAFVGQWLHPAAAHDTALDCLATCHVACAKSWATPPSFCTPASSDTTGENSPDNRSGAAWRAEAVAQLAHQHRAFSLTFLTREETFDWFNLVLCRTERGVARQLVLAAAMEARWCSAGAAAPLPPPTYRATAPSTSPATTASAEMIQKDVEDAHDVVRLSSSSFSCTADADAAVADLTRVFLRWVTARETASTATDADRSDAAAVSLLTGTSFRREGNGRLGDVGLLFADVAAALSPSFISTEFNSSVLALSPSKPSTAVALLLEVVRSAVTETGLLWERQMGQPSSHVKDDTHAVPLPLQFFNAAVESVGQRPSASVDRGGSEEEASLHDRELQLARLRSWLQFLCTCPPLLLADKVYVVVWLYTLMRQVEEMHQRLHESAGGAPTPLVPETQSRLGEGMHTHSSSSNSLTHRAGLVERSSQQGGGQAWSQQEEAETVRLAAASLSRQLWSTLPPSSLVPPMLLNWLLTRGGLPTWGDAVRFLRASAATATVRPPPETKKVFDGAGEGDHDDQAKVDDQRRYLFLVLPLDRVVSMAHAMRVLRTLQAVEERCHDAARKRTRDALPLSTRESSPSSGNGGDNTVVGEASVHRSQTRQTEKGSSRQAASSAATIDLRDDVAVTVSSTGANGTAIDLLVRHYYYPEIERVLLREWYSRALAAVLRFLVAHPEHTFLTSVADAPDHAALAVRAWLESGNAHDEQGSTTDREGVRASFAERLHAPDLSSVGASVTSLHEWQEWIGLSHQKKTIGINAVAALTEPGTVPLPPASQSRAADEHEAAPRRSATESYTGAALTIEKQRDSEELHQPNSTVAPTHTLRIPLHFVGTFILQECRIGAPVSTSFAEASARQAAMTGRAKLSSQDSNANAVQRTSSPRSQEAPQRATTKPSYGKRGRLRTLPSLDSLLQDTECCPAVGHDRLNTLEDAAARAAVSPDARRTRPVHPELLELFTRVLQIKKAEARGVDSTAAAREETVEDVVGQVLAHRAIASR
ncbi:hypothetical protein ABB37_07198 [Leptomonas pyrrhocoris]|uniref:Uncharacterized protein n=1 Tax=Leptomonas pyrrhocoris TaxID=157538 RepID=A0A0M9FW52_LEPPY|nr:hypothetical protein ABB37_07198 [Leptomonas pyrrhocoris]KPA77310.1 hypothetical protein ABB37_07198 [Leptomonas pyrrhocoris]|eukprot:XP_015655749.1 hypothetical protein ABB37_07198 [Leptomonas pyrrhocoris]